MSEEINQSDSQEKSRLGFGAMLTIGSIVVVASMFLGAVHPLLAMPLPLLLLLMVLLRIDWK